MKTCKIILIVLLAIKTLAAIIKVFTEEGDKQLEAAVNVMIAVPAAWLLYWGAGILDL